MRCGVRRLDCANGRVRAVELDDGGALTADCVLSSAGLPETRALCGLGVRPETLGRLAYVETQCVLNTSARELGWNDTIVFFNAAERLRYRRPDGLVDEDSGVICFPENYRYEAGDAAPAEGAIRLTTLANAPLWGALSDAAYAEEKEAAFRRVFNSATRFLGENAAQKIAAHTVMSDFSPRARSNVSRGIKAGRFTVLPSRRATEKPKWKTSFCAEPTKGFSAS